MIRASDVSGRERHERSSSLETRTEIPAMTFDPDAPAQPGSGIFGLDAPPEGCLVVILPVPFEATTSYGGGTSGGPAAVLRASAQVDLFDVETGHPWRHGICLLPEDGRIVAWNREARLSARPVIEAGGKTDGRPELIAALQRVNQIGSLINEAVAAEARRWLAQGKIFAVLGGDHSVPFGSIAAHAQVHPGLGLLHIDAHADLRRAFEGFTWSHASILHNVLERIPEIGRLVQVGVRDLGWDEFEQIRASAGRIQTHFDPHLAAGRLMGRCWAEQCARIVEDLPEEVYVTMDIDGLDRALCPHTGTPVPGGLSFHQFDLLLRVLVESGRRILGFDLVEIAPGPDGDEWDANVGARVLYKLIGWTLVSRGIEIPPQLPGTAPE
jgi:agmatinase